MQRLSIYLAMAMIFTALTACQQAAVKAPPRIIRLTPREPPLPDKTFREWRRICNSADECPRMAVRGMIQKAETFEEAEDAFSAAKYGSPLKRKALIGMLRLARGNSGLLDQVAACAGPIDPRIEALARRLAKKIRGN